MSRYMAVLFMVLAVGVMASAATAHNVPGDFDTITEALAAADPGDTITVSSNYTGAGEKFPILVQKDNITIQADGDVTVGGLDSHAVFVVGAFQVFNEDEETLEYEYETVKNVTIQGFTLEGKADIGIVVKYADNATITGNTIEPAVGETIYEGIRLVKATNSTISDNVIRGMGAGDDGIGINVERSIGNTLSGNTVTHSGLGLFMFKSLDNEVIGDIYTDNAFGGVVLNDTEENVLDELTVMDNAGWGVRFVHAKNDTLQNSVVTYNLGGGVQLIAARECDIDGNLVASNGHPDDTWDTVQIAVVPGDKALFDSQVFDSLNTLLDQDDKLITKPMSDFVEEKHQIESKLDLLEAWLDDLNDELENIWERVEAGEEAQAERELRAILRYQTGSYQITRDDIDGDVPVDASYHGMLDDTLNFTWWDYDELGEYDPNDLDQHPFDSDERWGTLSVAKLDFYSDPDNESFGLVRARFHEVYGHREDEHLDELMWDKIGIIEILIDAIDNELANTWVAYAWDHERGFVDDPTDVEALDSLQEKLDHWEDLGLLSEEMYDDLNAKLAAALGRVGELRGALEDIVTDLMDLYGDLGNITDTEATISRIEDLKADMHYFISRIRYNLALLDLELPPFPGINSDLVGKKEKPFDAITTENGEIDSMITAIEIGLNDIGCEISDTLGAIQGELGFSCQDWGVSAYEHIGDTLSRGNVISSNIVTSDLQLPADAQSIGILLASKYNVVVNNLITNEGLPELDDHLDYLNNVGGSGRHERIYRLDVGIVLMANECLIAYNALAFVDEGIKRGGTWDWQDYQLEYVFTKLANVSYWPGPGQVLELDRYDIVLEPDHPDNKRYPPMVDVGYLPVLRLQKKDVSVSLDANVVGNRLSLNFFDETGTGIEIFKGHSNLIDENLFFNVTSGNIIFRSGVGSGIVVKHNDHFGGVAIDNRVTDSDYTVDARRDYTPPTGEPGHATTSGEVNPPAATQPWAYDNFLTLDKFVTLEGWVASKMGGISVDLQQYQWEGLPPNLDFFGIDVTLPDQKPRHPNDVFEDVPTRAQTSKHFESGLHMVSVPLPTDELRDNVFKSVKDSGWPITIARWDPASSYVSVGASDPIDPGHGYWMYVYTDTTIEVSGTPPTGEYEVELATAGWHQVSTPTRHLNWKHVSFEHDGEVRSLADAINDWLGLYAVAYCPDHEDAEVDGYLWYNLGNNTNAGMDPWKGYWIQTLEDDITMILDLDADFPPTPQAMVPLSRGSVPANVQPPAPPALGALSADLLTAVSYPSPVTGDQATFRVTGLPVSEVRVTVLDLGGREVWQSQSAGNQLSWDLMDATGRTVANGVYLYQVEAKVGDQWVSARADRILIVR